MNKTEDILDENLETHNLKSATITTKNHEKQTIAKK